MDISDLLKEHAPEFDRKLSKIMEDTAGDNVLKEMTETFKDPEDARSWYFSSLMGLGFKRPYDYCKAGDYNTIIETLGKIRYSHH